MSSSDAAKPTSNGSGGDAQDLTVFVQTLLEQMQSRFAQMSDAIIGRIDEMGSRIDELEKSIADLMEQTNEDGGDKSADPSAGTNGAAKDKGESV